MAYFPYQNPYFPQTYLQSQQTQQSGIIWVTSEVEAQSFPVAPNNAVALWDSSRPSVYVKQADASGRPSIKIYDLTERSQMAILKPESSGYKITDFALKSEIDPILSQIQDELKLLKRGKKDDE